MNKLKSQWKAFDQKWLTPVGGGEFPSGWRNEVVFWACFLSVAIAIGPYFGMALAGVGGGWAQILGLD